MVAVFINLVLPISAIVFLLRIRQKYGIRSFALACAPLIGASMLVWAFTKNVFYYNEGPLNSAGFASWATVTAAISLSFVCAFQPRKHFRFAQGFLALVAANFWFFFAGWVV